MQILILGEHHLAKGDISDAEGKVSRLGYMGYWSAARRTGRGGTTGGNAVLVAKCLVTSHIAAVLGLDDKTVLDLPYRDVTPVVIHLRNSAVLIIAM